MNCPTSSDSFSIRPRKGALTWVRSSVNSASCRATRVACCCAWALASCSCACSKAWVLMRFCSFSSCARLKSPWLILRSIAACCSLARARCSARRASVSSILNKTSPCSNAPPRWNRSEIALTRPATSAARVMRWAGSTVPCESMIKGSSIRVG